MYDRMVNAGTHTCFVSQLQELECQKVPKAYVYIPKWNEVCTTRNKLLDDREKYGNHTFITFYKVSWSERQSQLSGVNQIKKRKKAFTAS